MPTFSLVPIGHIATPYRDGAKPEGDLRALGVASVTRALTLPVYHVARAHELAARMQPELPAPRARRS